MSAAKAIVMYAGRSGVYGGEHDEPMPDVIWYRIDGHSNGRWIYVDHPDDSHEGIPVGIVGVYVKHLSSQEARAMAAALVQAADEWDVRSAELAAERDERERLRRQCEELGGHEWPAVIKWKSDWICQRCGSAPQTSAVGFSWRPGA